MNNIIIVWFSTFLYKIDSYSMSPKMKNSFSINAIPLNKIDNGRLSKDLTDMLRSNRISGYDMRNITEKNFNYIESYDKSVKLKILMKTKP